MLPSFSTNERPRNATPTDAAASFGISVPRQLDDYLRLKRSGGSAVCDEHFLDLRFDFCEHTGKIFIFRGAEDQIDRLVRKIIVEGLTKPRKQSRLCAK